MQEYWKIVGKDGIELIQLSLEENRITIRHGPATGFMTRSEEPPEAAVRIPNWDAAEAIAVLLRNSTHTMFKNAKVIRA